MENGDRKEQFCIGIPGSREEQIQRIISSPFLQPASGTHSELS